MCHAPCHMLAGSTPQSAAWADLSSQRWRGKLRRNFANFKKPTCVRSERLRAAWCFMTQHKMEHHLIYWICKLEFGEGSRFTVIFPSIAAHLTSPCDDVALLFIFRFGSYFLEGKDPKINIFQQLHDISSEPCTTFTSLALQILIYIISCA